MPRPDVEMVRRECRGTRLPHSTRALPPSVTRRRRARGSQLRAAADAANAVDDDDDDGFSAAPRDDGSAGRLHRGMANAYARVKSGYALPLHVEEEWRAPSRGSSPPPSSSSFASSSAFSRAPEQWWARVLTGSGGGALNEVCGPSGASCFVRLRSPAHPRDTHHTNLPRGGCSRPPPALGLMLSGVRREVGLVPPLRRRSRAWDNREERKQAMVARQARVPPHTTWRRKEDAPERRVSSSFVPSDAR